MIQSRRYCRNAAWRFTCPLLGILLLCPSRAVSADPAAPFFEVQVARILKEKCVECHSATAPEAELDLSSPAGLLRGGESGAVVIAGRLDESLLWRRVQQAEMPPPEAKPLSDRERAAVRQWIAGGARFAKPPLENPKLTQHDVIPILQLRCTACHGVRRQEGGLDLRTKAAILKGGKSGPAAAPGKPDESLIIKRIAAEEMPPRRQLVSVSVKTVQSDELNRLRAWIAGGMPESTEGPDVATAAGDPLVRDEDRRHWAFQPPQRRSPPALGGSSRGHNPIDAFVLGRLEQRGMSLSPPAEKYQLLRRVYFDLVGLPPSPAELRAFLEDSQPLAYERVVDRLLASPRYGERWGRHWLDVAGYADSEGSQNEDRVRPHMHRYRDYVIRAWNAGKPYDRFLHEQIAGDELADYQNAATITTEVYDNLVATGFLRTAPDRTFADITNFVPDRLALIADEIDLLGSAVFGLTIKCARCHSHKFDPLPQRDYYRFAAILKDAYDEHDWLKPEQRLLTQVTTAERRDWERRQQDIERRLAELKQQLEAAAEADQEHLKKQIQHVEQQRLPEPRMRALWSRGTPSPTYILRRGDYLRPGREVGPGVPSVLTDGKTPFRVEPPWPGAGTTGRRLALARWLTAPDHPLTARVMVNRIWRHHFGRGLVNTLGNFGVAGEPPTHPDLLDWLAVEFVDGGWSIKRMHRLIVTSTIYRQSSIVSAASLKGDPDGRWLSRMPLRRLEAEALRDSLLYVAGRLSEAPFGPADDVEARGDGLVTSKAGPLGWRRSVYVLQRRTKLPTLLEAFDSPQMSPNCLERQESIVAPQALHLLNNAMVFDLAREFANRVRKQARADLGKQIELAYQLALSRPPDATERAIAASAIASMAKRWAEQSPANQGGESGTPVPGDERQRALVNFCHALMNSAGFIYID